LVATGRPRELQGLKGESETFSLSQKHQRSFLRNKKSEVSVEMMDKGATHLTEMLSSAAGSLERFGYIFYEKVSRVSCRKLLER
jgi:hypothetical protein